MPKGERDQYKTKCNDLVWRLRDTGEKRCETGKGKTIIARPALNTQQFVRSTVFDYFRALLLYFVALFDCPLLSIGNAIVPCVFI